MKNYIRHEKFGSCGKRESSKMLHFKSLATDPCPGKIKKLENGEPLFCNSKKNKVVAMKLKAFA